MYTDSENPPVAKLPFVLGDLALLATAGLLAWAGPRPLDAATLLGIVACVALGAVLLAVPFLLDYSRRQEQLADERQATIDQLVQTAAAAAEQASIAATSLHALARDTAESLAVMNQPRPTAEVPDHRAELRALREQVAELAKKLTTAPPPAAPSVLPPELSQRLEQLSTGLVALQAALAPAAWPPTAPESSPPAPDRGDASRPAAMPEPKKPRRAAKSREATGDTPPLFAEGLLNADISLHEGDAPPLAPEPTDPVESAKLGPPKAPPPADAAPDPATVETPPPPAPPAVPELSPAIKKPAAKKAVNTPQDGMTRLTVTAYIGIGNRLFLRGEGPGLSPTEGVPLQFVSIGKWRWEIEATAGPCKVSVWKNDEQRCEALGEFELDPGQAHEVTADF